MFGCAISITCVILFQACNSQAITYVPLYDTLGMFSSLCISDPAEVQFNNNIMITKEIWMKLFETQGN